MATRAEMKVSLLTCTPDAERVCAATARQCMTPENASDFIGDMEITEIDRILKHCIKSGHLAVLASASATVAVNVTRECLTQLNTHAFVKTVTQSQQYVTHRDFRYHVPQIFSIMKDTEQLSRFLDFMEHCQVEYDWHVERTFNNLVSAGWSENKAFDQAKQVARQVLPNAAEANTVLSGSLWAWYQWLSTRGCKRNTEFTFRVAREILEHFRKLWPSIFNRCGAPCEIDKCKEAKPCGEGFNQLPPFTRTEEISDVN